MTKRCGECRETLPAEAFCSDKSRKDGLNAYCRDCARVRARRWRAANVEKNRERQNRHAQTETRRQNRAEWRAANPERVAAHKAAYKERNPDEARNYYEAHKAESHARVLKRRALKRAATVGNIDLGALWIESGGMCPLCNTPIDRELAWPSPMCRSVDHIVPLSRGGTHEQSNLQWTHLVCNQQKGAKVPTHPSRRLSWQ